MRKKTIYIILILGLVMTLGYVTNPTYANYKEWFNQQAQEQYKEYKLKNNEDVVETTQLENSLMGFFANLISGTSIIREDHKIYSLYTMEGDEYDYKVLGMFNNFFVLKDENSQDN